MEDCLRKQMHAAQKVLQEDRVKARQTYKVESAERLLRIITRKTQTIFIGAVARIEARLGDLWGHGLPAARLTEQQKAYRQIWTLLRNEILTLGNSQLRAMEKEFRQYEIEWLRYNTNFTFKDPT